MPENYPYDPCLPFLHHFDSCYHLNVLHPIINNIIQARAPAICSMSSIIISRLLSFHIRYNGIFSHSPDPYRHSSYACLHRISSLDIYFCTCVSISLFSLSLNGIPFVECFPYFCTLLFIKLTIFHSSLQCVLLNILPLSSL